jgi:hypothetical protein
MNTLGRVNVKDSSIHKAETQAVLLGYFNCNVEVSKASNVRVISMSMRLN